MNSHATAPSLLWTKRLCQIGAGQPQELVLRTPRAIDSMLVTLGKFR